MVHISKQSGIGTFRIIKGLSDGHSGVSARKVSSENPVLCVAQQCVSVVPTRSEIQLIVHALNYIKCGIRLFDRALICGWYPN